MLRRGLLADSPEPPITGAVYVVTQVEDTMEWWQWRVPCLMRTTRNEGGELSASLAGTVTTKRSGGVAKRRKQRCCTRPAAFQHSWKAGDEAAPKLGFEQPSRYSPCAAAGEGTDLWRVFERAGRSLKAGGRPAPAAELPATAAIIRISDAELMRYFGYNVEVHKVTTADGYILEVDRILPSSDSNATARRTPMLLVHGLLTNAASWTANLPSQSPGTTSQRVLKTRTVAQHTELLKEY
ncbi:hypothetical protein HPB52_020347 [Rhipicephalus sanguineus]|uniref:Partial AB-hydrolase lipase domain-containing protein n=1 Tax=Rhipicephalus sanguineus TaxID=34632 RepID=A0A9D4PHU2_RHISA|nr:hypothetical protein HPB52_020347 [Rhipicephalus sanguineus]